MGKEGNQGTGGIVRLSIFLDTLGPKVTVFAGVHQCLRIFLFGYSGCPSTGPYKDDRNTTVKACLRSFTSHCFSQVCPKTNTLIKRNIQNHVSEVMYSLKYMVNAEGSTYISDQGFQI